MNEKRWIVRETHPNESEIAGELASQLNLSLPLSTLLVQRSITSFEAARHFFRADLSLLHDPFLMKDMQAAVNRLQQAIGTGEKILVYGDYDVDGSTSVAMFYDFLHHLYGAVDYYIPDRNTEGYGVSWAGIDFAEQNGFTLIVTLDCGIKSVDKIAVAQSRGIDFIICDHHRPGDELPPAVAVLDPKRDDCPYPFKELTGCGVGFKLMQAYTLHTGGDPEQLYPYLDLLMVSIASDIVPITGENRILARYGLIRLNESPRPGLKALILIAGISGTLSISQVVFGLAPRINAAGRIKHAREAVRLLLADDEQEALAFATEINQHNLERRNFDTHITDEALEMIQQDPWLQEAKSTVLYKEDWHKGVIGIVASRCIEHFHRPTIILTHSNGKAAGSARSVPGFDVYEAIEECSEYLEQFGGHTFAAGLTLPLENIPAFRLRFEEVVSRRISPEQLIPHIAIDMELSLTAVNAKFFQILHQMAPFGPGNMTPVFVSHQLRLTRPPVILKEKHLRLEVAQEGSGAFTAIGFGMSHFYPELADGKSFSMCYTLEENVFRGNRYLQLFIKDIKV